MPIEPGDVLFAEGDARRRAGGCSSTGSLDLVRHVGREDIVVGRMDVPGRWAGGFRAWDEHGIYLATGRGATPGRVLRLRRAAACASWSNHWFPFAGHLIGGLHHTAADHRVDRPAARLPGHARHAGGGPRPRDQQPGRRGDAARSTRSARLRALLVVAARLAGRESRPSSSPRSTRCAARSGAPGPLDPLAELADRESELADLAGATGCRPDWVLASALAAGGIDMAWCERVARGARRRRARAGPGVGRGHDLVARASSRR